MPDSTSSPPVLPPTNATGNELDILRSLLTKEIPEDDYSSTLWVILPLLFVMATFVLLLFVPAFYSIPLCFLAAAYMLYAERKRGIRSPIAFSLVILYPVLYVLLLTNHPYSAYFGLGVYSWLTIIGLTLLLIKKPLTSLYLKNGNMRLHYIISSIWTGSFALSSFTSYLLMPDTLYLIVPFCITIATFGITFYLTYFDGWLVTRRDKVFTQGDFVFKQVSYPSKEFDDYLSLYARHVSDEVLKRPEDYQVLREAMLKVDTIDSKDKISFGAYHNGTLVGTIALALPVTGEKHPMEQQTPLSFSSIRKVGPIADICRLSIVKGYREQTNVIRGLLKALIEVALERDIVFLTAEVFPTAVTFHYRLGLSPLFNRSHPHSTIPSYMGPLIIFFSNLAATIFLQKENINASFKMVDPINKLLAERWVKRQILRHAFSRIEQKPWMHTLDSIRYLIDPDTEKKEKSS